MFFRRTPKAGPAVRSRAGAEVGARLDADPAVTRAGADGIQLYWREDFLDTAACDRLIALIDAGRRPSTLMSDRAGTGYRTSESCDLDRWSPDIRPIDEAIAGQLGLAPEHGETMQGQRYAPGQHFRAHHDYFDPRESYWQRMKEQGGQRTWTAMVYLNDVAEGGATWFPQAGVRVSPKRGLLLAWNNMKSDGEPNPLTVHEGTAVTRGVKYIVTKWFREESWLKQAG